MVSFFQSLNRCDMSQYFLLDRLIVDKNIAQQGPFKILSGIEARSRQDFADTAIEALDHAVGLGIGGA